MGQVKDYHKLSEKYYEVALLLNKSQLPHIKELTEASKNELLHYQQEGLEKVVIIGTDCDACKNQNGRILTVAEALEKMPLPHKECSYVLHKSSVPFCTCCYAPHIDF